MSIAIKQFAKCGIQQTRISSLGSPKSICLLNGTLNFDISICLSLVMNGTGGVTICGQCLCDFPALYELHPTLLASKSSCCRIAVLAVAARNLQRTACQTLVIVSNFWNNNEIFMAVSV